MSFGQGLLMMTQCPSQFSLFLVTSLSLYYFYLAALEVSSCTWVYIIVKPKGMFILNFDKYCQTAS